jgi:hypothetical protein
VRASNGTGARDPAGGRAPVQRADVGRRRVRPARSHEDLAALLEVGGGALDALLDGGSASCARPATSHRLPMPARDRQAAVRFRCSGRRSLRSGSARVAPRHFHGAEGSPVRVRRKALRRFQAVRGGRDCGAAPPGCPAPKKRRRSERRRSAQAGASTIAAPSSATSCSRRRRKLSPCGPAECSDARQPSMRPIDRPASSLMARWSSDFAGR